MIYTQCNQWSVLNKIDVIWKKTKKYTFKKNNNFLLSDRIKPSKLYGYCTIKTNNHACHYIYIRKKTPKLSKWEGREDIFVQRQLTYNKYFSLQMCFGLFKEGIKIVPRRGSVMLLALLQKSRPTSQKVAGSCPVFELLEGTFIHPTKYILDSAQLLHNCLGAWCQVVEVCQAERIEQETVTRRTVLQKHRRNGKLYILNAFKL